MKNRKAQQKDLLLARLQLALNNTYHNARLEGTYVDDAILQEASEEQQFNAENEITYIIEGLGRTEREYKKSLARGDKQERHYWLVSQITNYGTLYTWGRGGATLAPDGLVNSDGCGFSIKKSDDFEEWNNVAITDLILTLEAFNRYVYDWCGFENQNYLLAEYAARQKEELLSEARDLLIEFKHIKLELCNLKLQSIICSVIRNRMHSIHNQHKKLIAKVILWNKTIARCNITNKDQTT